MAKIKPITEHTREGSKRAYDRIYSDIVRFLKMKLRNRGMHTLACSLLGDELKGADVLDIGCGVGRLSFIAAQKAKHVVGLDMMKPPIDVANFLKEAIGTSNIDFVLSPIEEYTDEHKFDVVFIMGTLEHIIDTDPLFNSIDRLLKAGGMLVINCPAESNFRGTISTLLLKLFNFPMSLSDVRVVTHSFIKDLAQKHGYEITFAAGAAYGRGWTDMAHKDLVPRITNVLKDVEDKVRLIDINKAAFDEWVKERSDEQSDLIEDWLKRDILKQLPTRPEIAIDKNITEKHGLDYDIITEFFATDFSREPYYSDTPPYNMMGGQSFFYLRKK